MMEIGKITYKKAMVFITLFRERNMKDTGLKEREMVRESTFLLQVPSMMVNGKITCNMVKVLTGL
jgi:hypothetical protein